MYSHLNKKLNTSEFLRNLNIVNIIKNCNFFSHYISLGVVTIVNRDKQFSSVFLFKNKITDNKNKK
jgi:hypothetical protein